MSRCLVTGGGGFIGSHLVDALLDGGHEVRVLDNFSTGDRGNLLHLSADVEILEGDLRSFERVASAASGCDLVFHQAALPSVPRSVQDPSTSNEVNATGTLNVLLAARNAEVQRLVYASSSSVYGATRAEVKHEELAVQPLSPYGVSKYAGEAYCRSFHEVYGLETVALRYFNIFGPRQSPVSEYAAVIPNFFAASLLDEAPVVYGSGEQCRDFTYVANAVQANLKAATAPDVSGKVFNVGGGRRTTVNALLSAVARVVGRPLEPLYLPARAGDVLVSMADISRSQEALGYEVEVDLDKGLSRTYEHFMGDESIIPRLHERRRWIALAS
jgi:UDP-glucose 4-epimerase